MGCKNGCQIRPTFRELKQKSKNGVKARMSPVPFAVGSVCFHSMRFPLLACSADSLNLGGSVAHANRAIVGKKDGVVTDFSSATEIQLPRRRATYARFMLLLCVCACVRACMRACVRACVRVCVCV